MGLAYIADEDTGTTMWGIEMKIPGLDPKTNKMGLITEFVPYVSIDSTGQVTWREFADIKDYLMKILSVAPFEIQASKLNTVQDGVSYNEKVMEVSTTTAIGNTVKGQRWIANKTSASTTVQKKVKEAQGFTPTPTINKLPTVTISHSTFTIDATNPTNIKVFDEGGMQVTNEFAKQVINKYLWEQLNSYEKEARGVVIENVLYGELPNGALIDTTTGKTFTKEDKSFLYDNRLDVVLEKGNFNGIPVTVNTNLEVGARYYQGTNRIEVNPTLIRRK